MSTHSLHTHATLTVWLDRSRGQWSEAAAYYTQLIQLDLEIGEELIPSPTEPIWMRLSNSLLPVNQARRT